VFTNTGDSDSQFLQSLASQVCGSYTSVIPCSYTAKQYATHHVKLHIQDIFLLLQVRRQLDCEAVIVQPEAAATAAAATAAEYSFDEQLQLIPLREPNTYSVRGASAADCVLCAVDQKAGLLAALGLAPVLVVVGVHRGPALGSGESWMHVSRMSLLQAADAVQKYVADSHLSRSGQFLLPASKRHTNAGM
jgi:hypothetical protein